MKITSLGHTECLLECSLANGKTWRLLLDAWLSDFSVADCMERTPRVSIDWNTFPQIDAVFVSHSHMDHLDPYFLTELYRHQSPILLLSSTLAYLVPTVREYLPAGTQIELLAHLQTRTFEGEVELTGLVFAEDRITNEDDVTTLFVAHGKDAAYFEIDTVPPMIYEEQQKLVDLFMSRNFKSRTYVHSANELEGNLKLFDFPTAKTRKEWARQYVTARKEEILERYETSVEHELPLAAIWKQQGFRSVFIGQGLRYPYDLSKTLAATSIFDLDQVAETYGFIASEFGIETPFVALHGGHTLDTKSGNTARAEVAGLSFSQKLAPNLEHGDRAFRAKKPLLPAVKNTDEQEVLILQTLNTKFLPTKIADQNDSLKQAIILEEATQYVIEVQFGNSAPFESRYYAWGFDRIRFERISPANGQDIPKIQERYFANDLVDFLEGRLELYCNFIQDLDPEMDYRLWTTLGATFLNHDIVQKKYRHHFENAKSGKTPRDSVLSLYQ